MDKKMVENVFEKLKKLKILLVGEVILDEYCFVEAVGRATKDPVLVTHFLHSEMYAGGVLATARHLANFVSEVRVVSVIGEHNSYEEFIKNAMPKNVKLTLFKKKSTSTIVKRAYVDSVRNIKLFKVSWINEEKLSSELSKEIQEAIRKEEKDVDAILVNDFGHELIDEQITTLLEKTQKFLAINVQANSGNFGFNLISKYNRADFISMNQNEIKLFFHRKDRNYKDMFPDFIKNKHYKEALLTLGKEGCLFHRTKTNAAPAYITKPIDTIGAGDALFALSAIVSVIGTPEEDVPFYAAAAGAAAAEYTGNKNSITKEDLLRFLIH